ncbi:hypothetical protein J6590_072925 [Homalodisca vitripennis]|nr:hypothetical protein J6590_072925 [Homalodisca vitripennis]
MTSYFFISYKEKEAQLYLSEKLEQEYRKTFCVLSKDNNVGNERLCADNLILVLVKPVVCVDTTCHALSLQEGPFLLQCPKLFNALPTIWSPCPSEEIHKTGLADYLGNTTNGELRYRLMDYTLRGPSSARLIN